ncbi:hypothetical protein A2U01_0074395 [Trifolium medium]|uniref:Uncharacterized protein n=1 Tax=Trifolium medium TaxID=97028 RepID=A0A392SWU6_9FABA|nr:hypothetical protein [Trifolium medium]
MVNAAVNVGPPVAGTAELRPTRRRTTGFPATGGGWWWCSGGRPPPTTLNI